MELFNTSEEEELVASPLSSVLTDFDEHELLYANKELALKRLFDYTPRSSKDNTTKILSSFVEYIPADSRGGKNAIITLVLRNSDDELFDLASYLVKVILLSLKASGGKTVRPSPFDEADSEAVAADMLQSPKRMQGILKRQCFLRDDYRCMVTGMFDREARSKYSAEKIGNNEVYTIAAHIIPFATAQYKDHSEEKAVSIIWADLFILFPKIRDKMNPERINDHSNILTLMGLIHDSFGEFTLALEPTNEDDEYIIKVFPKAPRFILPLLPHPNEFGERRVKFTSHDDRYALPSRDLLELHLSIANVLYASGMADEIDKILEDKEDLKCLASDGSTNIEMLLAAFNLIQITKRGGLNNYNHSKLYEV